MYSEALSIAHALHPEGIDGKVLFMFTAYLDDSGTHDGSLNVTVGGFVADVEQWHHFEREWAELLADYGLDETPGYFHMVDYEARNHPTYGTWSKEKRIEFMRRLTGIIRRRVSAGIAASLPAHNLQRIQKVLDNAFHKGYAYMTCTQVCWKNIGSWASANNHHEMIDSVFEAGAEGSGLVFHAHADLIKNHADLVREWHVGGIAFDTKRMKPLQAADFFAYESYKRMIESITDRKRWRKSVEAVISDIPVYATFLNDEATDDIVALLPKIGSSDSPPSVS